MKALTLHQPWASLIAVGAKSIETRSWSTDYRGPLAIHAGKDDGFYRAPDDHADAYRILMERGIPFPASTHTGVPLGAVVASARLVDVVPIVDDGTARNCVDVRVARPEAGLALRLDDYDLERDGFVRKCNRDETIRDIASERPFGDFSPGRFAWLLADVSATTERCPWCWRMGFEPLPDGMYDGARLCRVCEGRYRVDPVPARGRQGLWEWQPEKVAA